MQCMEPNKAVAHAHRSQERGDFRDRQLHENGRNILLNNLRTCLKRSRNEIEALTEVDA